jgi:hypothetical protein
MITHYAEMALLKVSTDTGDVIQKDATIQQNLRFDMAFRVLPDPANPNTANYPDIRAYLTLEAAGSFAPIQVSQTFIITCKTTP